MEYTKPIGTTRIAKVRIVKSSLALRGEKEEDLHTYAHAYTHIFLFHKVASRNDIVCGYGITGRTNNNL